jgi:hypothetical protein
MRLFFAQRASLAPKLSAFLAVTVDARAADV